MSKHDTAVVKAVITRMDWRHHRPLHERLYAVEKQAIVRQDKPYADPKFERKVSKLARKLRVKVQP